MWKQHLRNKLSSMSLIRDLSRRTFVGFLVALSLIGVVFLSSNATAYGATTAGSGSTQLAQFSCSDWDCTNYVYPSTLSLGSNGTAEIRQSNTACGWTGSYYDSLIRGTPPPAQGPTQGTPINSSLSSVSVQVRFLSRTLSSSSCEEYHLFVSLYFRLSRSVTLYCHDDGVTETSNYLDTQVRLDNVNDVDQPQPSSPTYCGSGVGAWGWSNNVLSLSPGQAGILMANATTQCQQAETAWSISGTSCTLTGIEIGTEGYGFSSLDTNWFNVTYTYSNSQPPPSQPPNTQPNNGGTCVLCEFTRLPSTPSILYIAISVGGAISFGILRARARAYSRRHSPAASG